MIDFKTLDTLQVELDGFTAHVTLNRPQVRNAMNNKMVEELTQVFATLRDNRAIRAVVLSGAGGVFCAGGDIKEMRERPMPTEESAVNLDTMLRAVNQAPQVVIARIEGVALGGGLGLVCVSDIAIAANDAVFGLPEVRLGVTPAFISPYVLQRIGMTRTRELALTGRRFKGDVARDYGIVHHACTPDAMDDCLRQQLDTLRKAAPEAIAATKELLFTVYGVPTEDSVGYRATLLNRLRQSDEAQEGLLAFMEKRPAKWAVEGHDD